MPGSDDLAGAAWLASRYGLELVAPLTTTSRIGGRRATRVEGEQTQEVHVESMRPEPTVRSHLTFHLKHEGAHLELLSRLFERIDVVDRSPADAQELSWRVMESLWSRTLMVLRLAIAPW